MTRKLVLLLGLLFAMGCSSLPSGSGAAAIPTVPVSGTVLYQDDFSNPSSGWEHVTNENGVMDYDGGVYRFLIHAPHMDFWATPGQSFSDARIEVDVVRIGGPESNRAGIVCRVNNEDLYFFLISNDGYYGIGRRINRQSTMLGQDDFAQTDAIKSGLAINHLRADCVGSTLSFYVNGFLVAQVNDSTLRGGEVGLLVGTFEEPNVDMIFDKFIVLQP